jgi:hypothetical protein
VPAAQALDPLPPSHVFPAGHCAHELCVFASPPAVRYPNAQSEQELEPTALYLKVVKMKVHATVCELRCQISATVSYLLVLVKLFMSQCTYFAITECV